MMYSKINSLNGDLNSISKLYGYALINVYKVKWNHKPIVLFIFCLLYAFTTVVYGTSVFNVSYQNDNIYFRPRFYFQNW